MIANDIRDGAALIVEDDEQMRALLKSLLHTLCFKESVGVASMAEALARLEYGSFTMAIVDLTLGDGDGVSVISAIRAHRLPLIRAMPVLVASTSSTSSRITASIAAGADAFLSKPFSITNLKRQIQFAGEKAAGRAARPLPEGATEPMTRPLKDFFELD